MLLLNCCSSPANNQPTNTASQTSNIFSSQQRKSPENPLTKQSRCHTVKATSSKTGSDNMKTIALQPHLISDWIWSLRHETEDRVIVTKARS